VAQHQSQCSIFANQQLKVAYLIFSSVRAVFGRPLPGFRFVADPRSSTRLASIPFPEPLQQLFSIQNQVPAMSRSELYLRMIFYP